MARGKSQTNCVRHAYSAGQPFVGLTLQLPNGGLLVGRLGLYSRKEGQLRTAFGQLLPQLEAKRQSFRFGIPY